MGIKRARGRYFDDRDGGSAPRTVIVDERLAQRFWGDLDPIGRRMYQPGSAKDLLKVDEHTRWLTVVGVIRSIRLDDLAGSGSPVGLYYFPYAQSPDRTFTFSSKIGAIQDRSPAKCDRRLPGIDPDLPLFDIRTMAERVELTLASRRTAMLLVLAFGALALFLSANGIYGVLAYLVAQRRREIGIRVALRSSGAGIVKLVMSEGMILVSSGLLLGAGGAVSLSRIGVNEVYGVKPLDPLLMVAVRFSAWLLCWRV